MTAPSHITVTAPAGVTTPIHPTDGHEPGGGQLRITSDVVARVRYAGSQSIRRAIARGDLVPCNMDGAPVASVDLAWCPEEPPQGGKWPKAPAKPAAPVRKEVTP